MAGPWERYQAQPAPEPSPMAGLKDQSRAPVSGGVAEGPWSKYAAPAENRVEQGFAVAGAQQPHPELQAGLDQRVQGQPTGGARGSGGFLETVDAGMRGAADALTFGTADEIAAGIQTGGGLWGDYGQALAQQRGVDSYDAQNHPVARIGGQMAGSVAGGLGAVNAAPGVARVALGMGGKSMPARIAQSAASGGILSAAHGFGSGEGGIEGRLNQAGSEAGVGALAGGAAPMVGAAIGQVAGRIMNKAPAPAPTAEDLLKAGRANYAASREAGVFVRPEGVKTLGDSLAAKLGEDGLDQSLTPGAIRALERIRMATDQPLRLQDVDTLRKIAGNVAKGADPTDAEFGRRIREGIDEYIDKLKPSDIMAGNAKEGVKLLTEARDLWKRGRKAELLEETLGRIELNTSVTGSGANIDNQTRQKVRDLLVGRTTRHLWSSEERTALKAVATGTKVGNALRLLGKAAPTGVVSGALSAGAGAGAAVGAGVAGPVGAVALPLAGYAAKKTADTITQRQFKVAMDMIRRGYPAPPRGSPIAAAYAQLISQGVGQGASGAVAEGARMPPIMAQRSP